MDWENVADQQPDPGQKQGEQGADDQRRRSTAVPKVPTSRPIHHRYGSASAKAPSQSDTAAMPLPSDERLPRASA